MARPNRSEEKRTQILPKLARAFVTLGYRRAATAELARLCGVREVTLYRLWPDKRSMFIAAIAYVYALSEATWRRLEQPDDGDLRTTAERVLHYESSHHGEFSHYRLVFAGLSESDDPEIRAALGSMFRRFVAFLRERVAEHRAARGVSTGDARHREDAERVAWAFIGLGTVSNIARELGLLAGRSRQRLIGAIGERLLNAPPTALPAKPARTSRLATGRKR